jgi:NADH-quinone oxidoreductase subunit N
MADFSMSNFVSIAPLLAMVTLFFVLLVFDLVCCLDKKVKLLWIAAAGMTLIAIGSIVFLKPLTGETEIWGGLIRMDVTGVTMIALVSMGTALTALFASDEEVFRERGEFAVILIAAAFGLSLMAVSSNLVMLYLSMEMAGIPLYVLAGILIYNRLSSEAGLKYLIYGAVSSAVMVYGFSLLLGLTGTSSFTGIQAALQGGKVSPIALVISFLLMMAGFGYKIAAVPFHFWAPDVYTGAATSVSGFLATVSKAAGFVVLLRFLPLIVPAAQSAIRWVLVLMAVASMLVGNLLAMQQKNVKRLLAFSSIAHAGYLLVAVAAFSAESVADILYYLTGYLFTNLAAFASVTAASHLTGSDDLSSYSGLSRRNPALALLFLIVFLSLAGIPPFAGFAGKFFIFLAAANAGLAWLVVVGVLNSVLALFYYLNVLKVIYARPEEEGQTAKQHQPLSGIFKAALIFCAAAILYFGVVYLPWYDLLVRAGQLLWS